MSSILHRISSLVKKNFLNYPVPETKTIWHLIAQVVKTHRKTFFLEVCFSFQIACSSAASWILQYYKQHFGLKYWFTILWEFHTQVKKKCQVSGYTSPKIYVMWMILYQTTFKDHPSIFSSDVQCVLPSHDEPFQIVWFCLPDNLLTDRGRLLLGAPKNYFPLGWSSLFSSASPHMICAPCPWRFWWPSCWLAGEFITLLLGAQKLVTSQYSVCGLTSRKE